MCAPDDGWGIHPKHVEQFTETNKLCNVASCWLYFGTYILILCSHLHLGLSSGVIPLGSPTEVMQYLRF